MFRLNLYFPLLVALLVASIATIISVLYMQENTIHQSKEKVSEQYTQFLNQKVKYDADVLSEYINFIQTNNDLAAEFQKGNKQQIYTAMEGIYSRLNKNIELTHMYFIKTDGTVLLRVHDYDKDKDTIDRATFKKAQNSQKLVYGLEFGLKMNYTLRVVKPWYVNGILIGYIELGKEIDKITDEYANLLKTHIYLAIKKDIYADAPDFVNANLKQKILTDNYYIAYNTFAVPEQIGSILNGTLDHEDITFKNRDYYISKMKFSDFSKKELGYIVFLQDVTIEHNVMYGSVKALVGMLVVLSSIFFLLGYQLIKRKEKHINALTSELNEQKESLSLNNRKLQKLFDLQKNIIVLTDGKTLRMANKSMLEFFGFNDLEHFLEHNTCICDKFIEDNNFFHLGKADETSNWVKTLTHIAPENRIVGIYDKENKTHIFSISLNEFETDNYLISFADISNTMRDQIKLIQKVTHDTLTGAFNREFLENSIYVIVKEAEPNQLGVIMCDIDFFKRVNDTYGHNRGDEVLKQFASTLRKSIRNEDYLIRWGGEEFIILMKVDSMKSLQKIAEHVRIAVQDTYFEEVKNITVSLGATLYQKEEVISESIARADKALYTAKANGRNQVCIEEGVKDTNLTNSAQ